MSQPPGLLSYLDSTDKVPVISRDLINIRDNLKIANDQMNKNNKRVIQQSLQVIEKQIELVMQHWRARMGIESKNVSLL